MVDIKTAKIIVWGMKDRYQTHSHIHEAIFRAAKFMRPESLWLDNSDDLSKVNWSNSIIITEHKFARCFKVTFPLTRVCVPLKTV